MPFADNQGARIHYEVEGQGPPLVLHHGFAMDLSQWHLTGWVDALGDRNRLVLVDPRGHGASDKPHDPQMYRKALMAGDVTAVLYDLGIEKAHFFGYSMGGIIGFAIARFAPERLGSLIVGGASPYEQGWSGPNPVADAWISLLSHGAQAFIDGVMPAKYRSRLSADRIDPEALIAVLSLRERAGLADDLPHTTIPCLLFAGENDPKTALSRKCAEEMPAAEFVMVPGADHVEAIARIDLVLPHLKRFLAEVACQV